MVARAILPKDGNVPMHMLNRHYYLLGHQSHIGRGYIHNIREVCTVNEKQHSASTEQEREEVLNNVLSTMPEPLLTMN